MQTERPAEHDSFDNCVTCQVSWSSLLWRVIVPDIVAPAASPRTQARHDEFDGRPIGEAQHGTLCAADRSVVPALESCSVPMMSFRLDDHEDQFPMGITQVRADDEVCTPAEELAVEAPGFGLPSSGTEEKNRSSS